jgi:phenylpropionate dioxygenase-like ring-hydroxylating dioxygenase large terminal subunit
MASNAEARFLRNTWYVAAWSQDVAAGAIFSRRILGEALVFFRDGDGRVAALADYCPHRFAPLRLGQMLPNGRLRCGYHGLEYDGSGTCTHNPHGNGVIPAAAVVPSYPVVERYGIVWIWMGTRTPDPSRLPDFSIFDGASEERIGKRDHIIMQANIDLVTINLLDLSHVSYLHDGILGNAETVAAETGVEQRGDTLYVTREQDDVEIPLVYRLSHKPDVERGDLWRVMRWDAPGNMLLDAGTKDRGASRDDGSGYYGIHLLTPETATTTHYHFSSVRRRLYADASQDDSIRAEIARLRRIAFEDQDEPMIAAQQQTIRELEARGRTVRPALLSVDAGPARYRRIMDKLLAED